MSSCLAGCCRHGDQQLRRPCCRLECLMGGTRRRVHSASSTSLDVRRTRLSTVGNRAFPVSAARLEVFHRASLLSPLSPSSAVILNHISSHFLIPLSDSSLICTVPTEWLVILDTIIDFTFNILTTRLLELAECSVSRPGWSSGVELNFCFVV